jgi:aromatic-L-amino-acid/L-tryptophan decarboxylase
VDASEFRRQGHALIDWIAEYLDHPERYPVLPRVAPGDVRAALPRQAPERGESFDDIFRDFERVLVPALTHWNHPGFFAYFAISAAEPAILAELLSAALNQQAMLWRTSPAATELEAVTLDWLRKLLGLPNTFEGVIYDTASISTLHALAAARERLVPGVREHGLAGWTASRTGVEPVRQTGQLRVYCSEQAHSSVDKAVMLLGLGHASLKRIACDDEFRMRSDALRAAMAQDVADGHRPIAVVATFGTTATTSVDPLAAIAAICREHGVWLHVDAAYAGVTAVIPELRSHADGWEQADSIVLNPHKWLFVPFDLSVLYCRHMDTIRAAFSLVPDILRTPEGDRGVRNLMDTGIQLGRRFRALKLWMVLRHFGAEGVRELLKEHMRLATLFAAWVDGNTQFERLAPVPFSVVCFRARPHGVAPDALDAFNERLVDAVNATGELFLSHTRVKDVVAIRLAIGNARTAEAHVARAWELLQRHTVELEAQV